MNEPLDEAFAAYLRSCDAGQLSSREDFLAQFPELEEQLRELMDAADMLSRIATPKAAAADQVDTVAIQSVGVGGFDCDGDLEFAGRSEGDLEETLPVAVRGTGDHGPTLPFDLGDYQLLRVLGRGGMGVVYLANQKALDRQVAVKMIRSGTLADEAEVRRFYMEAQSAARLRHPGIVSVHQFGRRAGHHFFSMEYIEGKDLQRVIQQAPLEPKQAARYVRDVAAAIHHAHELGVLHRDLKPANVLIDEEDQVHVTDFGLAKHLDAEGGMTASGAAVGTPHYMAPEQAIGHSDRATRQSDVYSLGAILFACLTGRPPIVADTVMQTLLQVAHQPAPALRSIRRDAPADLETIVAKCLEKNPAKRYGSAEALAADLDCFLEGQPIAARPRARWIKAWHWLEGVPVIAALMGRRVSHASLSHRRFQTAMLGLLVMTPLAITAASVGWLHHRDAMPGQVRIGGGLSGGAYQQVATGLVAALQARFAVEAEVVPSEGSVENREKLVSKQIDLAPLQGSDIRGDDLCVVAPLFYEAVHVMTRETPERVGSLKDVAGLAVAVGPTGSGSRQVAEFLFASYAWEPQAVTRVVIPWRELMTADNAPPVAIICGGLGSPLVSELLASGNWRLVPIPDGIEIALQHPTLRPMTIESRHYPDGGLGVEGVATVGTTAFLAARSRTPSALVTAMLEALYSDATDSTDREPDGADRRANRHAPPWSKMELIPRHHAAEWQGLAFHPAARRFYAQPASASD